MKPDKTKQDRTKDKTGSLGDLHDLSRDDRLQGVEVVGQVGQGVLGPQAVQPEVRRGVGKRYKKEKLKAE